MGSENQRVKSTGDDGLAICLPITKKESNMDNITKINEAVKAEEEKRPQVPFSYTRITSSKSRLSKEFYLETDGQGQGTLQKQGGGQLWEGKVEVRQVESLQKYLSEITSSDGEPWVAVYGLPKKAGDIFELVTTNNVEGELGQRQITRTKECFDFAKGEPGFLVEDYDPQKFMPDPRDTNILTKEELLDIIYKVMPEWKENDIQISIVDSTSSYIYRTTDGQKLKGEGGKRIIVPVDDASQIPVISEELEKRLWLTGYGRHKITKAGSLVKTTIFDLCYGKQPERIDFTPAGAICRDGVEQRRPEPLMVGTKIMVAEDLLLTSNRKNATIKELVQADRKNREKEAEPVRKIWLAARVEEIIRKNPNLTRESARAQAEAEYKGELGMDSTVRVEGFDEPVSVAEVLADRVGFHGKKCYPPMSENDADYQRFCSVVYSNQDEPVIHTFAHGGMVFSLPRWLDTSDTRKEWVFPFDQENDAGAKKLLAELVGTQEFFSKPREKAVFVVREEGLVAVDETQLETEITNRYRLVVKKRGEEKELRPRNLKRIWANGQVQFPKCSGLVRVPILHEDGTWKTETGYDPATGYYLKGSWEINPSPTREETKAALNYILNHSWGEYTFDDTGVCKGVGKGVLLSLILSGFAIPITEIRPGYIITAARRDSGKTKLASTINTLIDDQVSVKDLNRETNDLERQLEGDRRLGMRVQVFDNLTDGRELYEAKMAMLVTASSYTQKKLHSNDSLQTKNDFIQIFTGNNITSSGDNTRRYFLLYILGQPGKEFRHEPVAFVKKHRDKIIQSVVTLINAYREAGSPLMANSAISSFERWDRVVRQNILWLAREFPEFGIGDPRENILQQEAANSRDRQIRHLFETIYEVFQDGEFCSGDNTNEMVGCPALRQAWAAFFPNDKNFHDNPEKIGWKFGTFKNRREEVEPGVFLTLTPAGSKKNKPYYKMVREVEEIKQGGLAEQLQGDDFAAGVQEGLEKVRQSRLGVIRGDFSKFDYN